MGVPGHVMAMRGARLFAGGSCALSFSWLRQPCGLCTLQSASLGLHFTAVVVVVNPAAALAVSWFTTLLWRMSVFFKLDLVIIIITRLQAPIFSD